MRIRVIEREREEEREGIVWEPDPSQKDYVHVVVACERRFLIL